VDWLAIGLLLPGIGVIGGIYYALKGKRGAICLLSFSIAFWIIWIVLFNLGRI
jgi:hypothetical protein